jgi:outer membrane immunogenic protein
MANRLAVCDRMSQNQPRISCHNQTETLPENAIAPNFTANVVYLYDFINARRVIFDPVPGFSIQFNTRTMYHIARVRLNYNFDWLSPLAAPVTAKY